MKRLISVLLIMLLAMGMVACGGSSDSSSEGESAEPAAEEKENSYGPGDSFDFEGFEVTISDVDGWDKVKNEFAEENGKEVFRVKMTEVNNSDETGSVNMFSYKAFSPSGTELNDVNAYFDDSSMSAGEVRSGGTIEAYVYMLYEGDGDYVLEFDDWSKTIEVIIPVKK